MNKSSITPLILILLITCPPLYAQHSVARVTTSITDTSFSDLQNAENIYNWITNNIAYNTKAFQNKTYHSLPADKVLSKGKGICGDYSLLCEEMCREAGIECYTISGYSKGFGHYEGKYPLRADHAWNVMRSDSTWYMVDATWGSGYLYSKPCMIRKYLYLWFNVPYKCPLKFKQSPSNKYFCPNDSVFIEGQYPLDPKWFNNETPISFYYFLNDTNKRFTDYFGVSRHIEDARFRPEPERLFLEGNNGIKYNRLNYFDKALGIYQKNIQFDYNIHIDSNNYKRFQQYANDFEFAYGLLELHKSVNDSIFGLRLQSLKEVSRKHKSLERTIASSISRGKKTYKSTISQVRKKSKSLKKRNKKLNKKMAISYTSELPVRNPRLVFTIDSVQIQELLAAGIKADSINNVHASILDSLYNSTTNIIASDKKLDDRILVLNAQFSNDLITYKNIVLGQNETEIRNYLDTLIANYQIIKNELLGKKAIKNDLSLVSRSFSKDLAQKQKAIKLHQAYIRKLYSLSNYDEAYIDQMDTLIYELIDSYKHSMNYNRQLEIYNQLQKEFRMVNLRVLRAQKRMLRVESNQFKVWYASLYGRTKHEYDFEKFLTKKYQAEMLRLQKRIEAKVKRMK